MKIIGTKSAKTIDDQDGEELRSVTILEEDSDYHLVICHFSNWKGICKQRMYDLAQTEDCNEGELPECIGKEFVDLYNKAVKAYKIRELQSRIKKLK